MTATLTNPALTEPSSSHARPIARTAAIAGAAAAVATTAVGSIAEAAEVPLVVGGMDIQLPAFALFTFVGAALGGLIASQLRKRSTQPRRAFLLATAALTVLSVIPDVAGDATTATKLTLIGAHVLAAAMIIPALARRLPTTKG